MAFPKTLTIRYFQLINNRQFTEAHRQLQRIKEQIKKTEWNKGYYKALTGMFLAQKHNGNPYTFLQNLNLSNKTTLKQLKTEFQTHIQSRFHEDYDRGYFSAWHDYTRLLLRTIEENKPKEPQILEPQKTSPQGQTSLAQYAETSQQPV